MAKYSITEINDFVVAYATAEHYDADLKLYRRLFPNSNILPELERAFEPRKKQLDERMLLEIMKADRICMDTILENRGIKVPVSNKDIEQVIDAMAESNAANEAESNEDTSVDESPSTDDTSAFELQLLESDVVKMKYNEKKKLAFGLQLETPDQKGDTLTSALVAKKEELLKKKG